MSYVKCSQCGLTNFLTAEHCKRCKASLSTPSAPEESNSTPAEAFVPPAAASKAEHIPYDTSPWDTDPYETKPRGSISPLRILAVILLLVGLTWYFFHSEDIQRAASDKKTKETHENSYLQKEHERNELGRGLQGSQ